jgi:hypothetical protein
LPLSDGVEGLSAQSARESDRDKPAQRP